MSTKLLPEPERWADRPGGNVESSAEDAVGASFKQIRTATEPSSAAAARWARLAMAPAPAPRRVGPRLLAAALTVTLLVGGGAAAGVAWHASVTSARERARSAAETREPSRPRHAARSRAIAPPAETSPEPELAPELSAAPEAPLPDPAPAIAPAPAPVAPAAPTPGREASLRIAGLAPLPTAAPGARAATEPPPLAAAPGDDEAQIVARAFRHLRSEHDAAAAIAALDEHDRRFGAGALTDEAAIARVEALLLLRRTDEALPPLLALRGTPAGRTPEVRAVRAELLARAHRCDEAEADLDVLLAPGAPAATRERARRARAACARRP